MSVSCPKISNYKGLSGIQENDIMIPEPWDGDISNALILVLSSNPAYTKDELFPTKD